MKRATSEEKRLKDLNAVSTEQLQKDYKYWIDRAKEARIERKGVSGKKGSKLASQDRLAERTAKAIDTILEMRNDLGIFWQ